MVGQLLTFVPAQVHLEAYQRCGPRAIEAIFVGFAENHGSIENVAMLIPLEALLAGTGSVKQMLTTDWRQSTSERQVPMARMREWSLMLKGAKLMSSCSSKDFGNEIVKLIDPNIPHFPKIMFEQPVGVSHRMGHKHAGPWEPTTEDHIETSSNPLAIMAAEAEPDQRA